jgi:dimethylargininase
MLRAICRRPGAEDLARCELSHQAREPIDPQLLGEQHAAYVAALEACGARTQVLEPLAGFPDALYVEDTAIVLDEVAVLTRPGAESRRGELATIEAALAEHRELLRIEGPGTVDGGDVLVVDGVLYVGCSGRTNHAGLKQLASGLLSHGYMVKAAEVSGCLHLKSAVTRLDDERLLACPGRVNLERVRGMEIVPVPPEEPDGANVLALNGRVLCSSAYPRTNGMLAARGYDLIELDLSELHKMEAAVTCPSLILRS